jgi:hypothetical protein
MHSNGSSYKMQISKACKDNSAEEAGEKMIRVQHDRFQKLTPETVKTFF